MYGTGSGRDFLVFRTTDSDNNDDSALADVLCRLLKLLKHSLGGGIRNTRDTGFGRLLCALAKKRLRNVAR
jgi:hypothetical protein